MGFVVHVEADAAVIAPSTRGCPLHLDGHRTPMTRRPDNAGGMGRQCWQMIACSVKIDLTDTTSCTGTRHARASPRERSSDDNARFCEDHAATLAARDPAGLFLETIAPTSRRAPGGSRGPVRQHSDRERVPCRRERPADHGAGHGRGGVRANGLAHDGPQLLGTISGELHRRRRDAPVRDHTRTGRHQSVGTTGGSAAGSRRRVLIR